jgi:ribosomal protein S18 acetylase RimI-like enzyme
MSKQKIEGQNTTFRRFHGENDFSIMHSILMASAKADQVIETATVDDIKNWCAPSDRFDPRQNMLFALGKGQDDDYAEIGFSRVSWYTGKENIKLYCHTSYLLPEHRKQGIWSEIVRESEHRLREISAGHTSSRRFFQSWAAETQKEWISVLEREGYKAVRHFNNMIHGLDRIPEPNLPEGLEVRTVQTEDFRRIWGAQKEVQKELFETVAENWTDDNYTAWLKNPSHTPHLWQVAWDGDQVAGMVLVRISEAENRELDRKRGYTEHVFVRRRWRQRGLATALMARSLLTLKNQGMEEAELGVDSENESGAFRFYKGMGYQTVSIDIWFRKAMDVRSEAT